MASLDGLPPAEREVSPAARDHVILLRREHERVAMELHSLLISRMSRLGFALSGITSISRGQVAERSQAATDEVDELIRLTRLIVFDLLGGDESVVPPSSTLHLLAADAERRTGCASQVSVEDCVDGIGHELTHHLEAVAREAVDNVIKHADATKLVLDAAVTDHCLEFNVTDDGVGLPPAPALGVGVGVGVGVGSMDARARALGGRFTIGPGSSGGTVIQWAVPLSTEQERTS